MNIYQINPTTDSRWSKFVQTQPSSSVFHSVAWLEALRSTYGYLPVVFTTSAPDQDLENGLVFCDVNSWLTGRRLISLPFSDHCEPLCDSVEDLNFILRHLQTAVEHRKWKYLEVRPVDHNLKAIVGPGCSHSVPVFLLHVLDLRPDIDSIFASLDKNSVQRRIRRAEKADLVEIVGRTDDLLNDFYNLFVATRRRHRAPPIPYAWFRNLITYQREALEIRLAYKGGFPVSGILTLRFKDAVYYKYGCADSRFNKFGGMPWLLWRGIAAAKSNGAVKFDLGRSEEQHVGLVAFKNHWVAQPKRLEYWTFPENRSMYSINDWRAAIAKRIFSRMPDRLLKITGQLIYRHIA
jgi:Acetyltransferase (GNAT) domain